MCTPGVELCSFSLRTLYIREVPEKRIKILYCPEREGGLRGESKGLGVQFWVGPLAVSVVKSSYNTDGPGHSVIFRLGRDFVW
jgi:hypothetical protein